MAEGKRQKAEGLPEGWREVKLGDVGKWRGGGTPSKSNAEFWRDGTIPWVSPKDMKSKFISDAEDYITESAVRNSSTSLVDANSLLVVTRSGILRHSLPTAITTRPVAINQDIKSLTPSVNNDVVYLANVFWGFEKDLLEKCQKDGTTVESIDFDALKNYSLLLPPLPEQRKIAAILSTWDDSLATLTDLIAAKRQQKRGLAEALLTGQKRLPGFEGEWERKKLGEVLFEPKQEAEKEPHKIELLTVKLHVKGIERSGKFPAQTKAARPYYKRFEGEILIGRQNFHNGGVGIVGSDQSGLIASNAISSYVTKQDDLKYVFYSISRESFYSIVDDLIGGTGQKEISRTEFAKLQIPLPPLPEQQAIASILSTLDGEIASLEALRSKVQEQKRGLMDELLTGRIRVKVNVEDSV